MTVCLVADANTEDSTILFLGETVIESGVILLFNQRCKRTGVELLFESLSYRVVNLKNMYLNKESKKYLTLAIME